MSFILWNFLAFHGGVSHLYSSLQLKVMTQKKKCALHAMHAVSYKKFLVIEQMAKNGVGFFFQKMRLAPTKTVSHTKRLKLTFSN